jgi:hypothetical protein
LRARLCHRHGFVSASRPSARGRPPLLAVRWPRATGLTSDLSGCLWLMSQRCVVSRTAGVPEVLRVGPRPFPFPDPEALFVRLSPDLAGGTMGKSSARALRSVLAHSSSRALSGVTAIHPDPKPVRPERPATPEVRPPGSPITGKNDWNRNGAGDAARKGGEEAAGWPSGHTEPK